MTSYMGLCTPSPPNINRLNLINLGHFKNYDPLATFSMSRSKKSSSVLMQLFMTTSGYTTIFNRKKGKRLSEDLAPH